MPHPELTNYAATYTEHRAARVTNNSMVPDYGQGATIIYTREGQAMNGDDAVVELANGGCTFRRVYWTDDGLQLCPLNPDYETIVVPLDQVVCISPCIGQLPPGFF